MKGAASRLLSLWTALLFVPAFTGQAQTRSDSQSSPPIPAEAGRKQARELIGNLLKLRPLENAKETLLVKVTDRDDARKEVPVLFSIAVTPTNFLNIYETAGEQGAGTRLTIIHAENKPNEYLLSQPPEAPARKLTASELRTAFAGSDFWVIDLGLEFLHWPEQRILRKQMRRSLFCDVLESLNPQPDPAGYSKVVSWVAVNRPDDIVIVHADAYDAQGKLLKQFAPRKIRKVDGAWQLAEMEIRNRQTRSTTLIEFTSAPP